MCCAVRKGVVGSEEVARLFVPHCGIGQVELPSFTIELLLGVAIPRRALKSLKREISAWVLLLYDFSYKINQKLNNPIKIRAKDKPLRQPKSRGFFSINTKSEVHYVTKTKT